jgi:arsenite methyltransferase
MKSSDIKRVVQEKYGQIAQASTATEKSSCGCSPGCCSSVDYTVFSEDYRNLEGYNPEADLNLGCGIPVEFAGIRPGDQVLDLGSGAGNDCFVAGALVGDAGQVTGLDFTDQMLQRAEENRRKLGYSNIDFVKGDIEEMPLPGNKYDVVLSNCVLNLVPDKRKAFNEIMRVLKPGGHFCVSDVVTKGRLHEKLCSDAELYAGCIAGASEIEEYSGMIRKAGFENIVIHKEKKIQLPDTLLPENSETGSSGIFSITVSASKPFNNS